jgi:hypothetical protein
MKLVKGQRYRAEIDLPWPAGAWSGKAESQLRDAGFTNVRVFKSGGDWYAEGIWTGESMDVDLPSRISNVAPI